MVYLFFYIDEKAGEHFHVFCSVRQVDHLDDLGEQLFAVRDTRVQGRLLIIM
jgi:hypothetical protein